MADKYYILSKNLGDGAYLIGELTRLGKREYRFQYLIRGDEFPHFFMRLPGLNEIGKVYTGDEACSVIRRLVPGEDHMFIDDFLEDFEVSEYNEWDLLDSMWEKYIPRPGYDGDQPLHDSHEIIYFYKEIPRKVKRFDK